MKRLLFFLFVFLYSLNISYGLPDIENLCIVINQSYLFSKSGFSYIKEAPIKSGDFFEVSDVTQEYIETESGYYIQKEDVRYPIEYYDYYRKYITTREFGQMIYSRPRVISMWEQTDMLLRKLNINGRFEGHQKLDDSSDYIELIYDKPDEEFLLYDARNIISRHRIKDILLSYGELGTDIVFDCYDKLAEATDSQIVVFDVALEDIQRNFKAAKVSSVKKFKEIPLRDDYTIEAQYLVNLNRDRRRELITVSKKNDNEKVVLIRVSDKTKEFTSDYNDYSDFVGVVDIPFHDYPGIIVREGKTYSGFVGITIYALDENNNFVLIYYNFRGAN